MGYTGVTQGIGAGLLPCWGALASNTGITVLTAVIGLPLDYVVFTKNAGPGVLPKQALYSGCLKLSK